MNIGSPWERAVTIETVGLYGYVVVVKERHILSGWKHNRHEKERK